MRDDLESAEIAALGANVVVVREFVWITARDRSSGAAYGRGFWNGFHGVTTEVIDALTGSPASRQFSADGALLSIGSLSRNADLTVRTVEFTLSQIHPTVADLIRGAEPRNAAVQIYRGFLDPATHALLARPKPQFAGTVDGTPIETPAAGGSGGLTVSCVSSTRELTLPSTDTRSHESQRRRNPNDRFYVYAKTAPLWQVPWGQAN